MSLQIEIIKKSLQEKGFCYVNTKGFSMAPFINNQTRLKIIPAHEIKVGDIVLYEQSGKLILHQVIEINGEMVATKGTNNSMIDFPISIDKILAKADIEIENNLNFPRLPKFSSLVFNIWGQKPTIRFQQVAQRFGIKYYNQEKIDLDYINLAFCPTSNNNIDIINNYILQDKPIMIHLNVPISDFDYNNFIHIRNFADVFRIGTPIASFDLTQEECLLFIIGYLIQYYQTS